MAFECKTWQDFDRDDLHVRRVHNIIMYSNSIGDLHVFGTVVLMYANFLSLEGVSVFFRPLRLLFGSSSLPKIASWTSAVVNLQYLILGYFA